MVSKHHTGLFAGLGHLSIGQMRLRFPRQDSGAAGVGTPPKGLPGESPSLRRETFADAEGLAWELITPGNPANRSTAVTLRAIDPVTILIILVDEHKDHQVPPSFVAARRAANPLPPFALLGSVASNRRNYARPALDVLLEDKVSVVPMTVGKPQLDVLGVVAGGCRPVRKLGVGVEALRQS